MALFGRRKQVASEPASPATTDWTDLSAVRAEWGGRITPEEGLLGWRNGTRLAAEGPVPGQLTNTAEYLTRAFPYRAAEDDLLSDDQLAAAIETVLHLLERAPMMFGEYKLRDQLVRLVLTVARQHGWQPRELGGDGRIRARFDSPMVYEALRYDPIPRDETVRYFFGVSTARGV